MRSVPPQHPVYARSNLQSFPRPFFSVGILPGVAFAGLVGSAVGYSLNPEERPSLQRQMVNALENGSDADPDDANSYAWTSPQGNGNSAKISTPATTTRTVSASIRRKREIDALPPFTIIGETYFLIEDSPIYSGLSTDKSEVDSLKQGAEIFVVGRVSDPDWLIVGRNDQAIGYLPADRAQKSPVGPAMARVYTSSARGRDGQRIVDSTADTVSVITKCRSLNYAIDNAYGNTIEKNTLAACKTAEGGWVQVASDSSSGTVQ